MKRIFLLFTGVTLVATMVFMNVVSGVAEEDPSTGKPPFIEEEPPSFEEEPPFEDEPPFFEEGPPFDEEPPFFESEPPFEDTADEPLVEDGPEQEVPLCAPGWLQEWYPDWASGWWYFWWFQYCYTSENGWYRMYDVWEWGYPMY